MHAAAALKPAVFLDRDGTLNFDPGYISAPDQIKVIPRVPAALKLLKEAGYLLIVISNQSGVGRGKIARTALPEIHRELERQILEQGGAVPDHYELCFHRPDENCACRKPGSAMVEVSSQMLHVDLSRSVFVGDKDVDIQCGQNSGVGRVALVQTGDGKKTLDKIGQNPLLLKRAPDFIGADLFEVARWVTGQKA